MGPKKDQQQTSGQQQGTSNPSPDQSASTAAQQVTPDIAQLLQVMTQALEAISRNQQPPQPQGTSSTAPPPPGSAPHPIPVVRGLPLPRLASPDELTIHTFRDWKQRWEDYSSSNQLQQQTVETQQGILRSALHTDWTMLWSAKRLPIITTTPVADILKHLESYLRQKRNPLLDRQQFHRRDQQKGESVDQYYSTLRSLDEACAHDDQFFCCDAPCATRCTTCRKVIDTAAHLQDIRIRDRLICGLSDKEMQRRVLSEQYSTLTVDQVLTICTAMESSSRVGGSLNSSHPPPEAHGTGKRTKSTYKKRQAGGQDTQSEDPKSDPCWGCGKSPRHKKENCPAAESKCEKCGFLGHYTRLCKGMAGKGKRQKPDKQPPPPPPQDNHIAVNAGALQLLQLEMTVDSRSCFVQWLPDPGSEVDAISEKVFRSLGEPFKSALTLVKIDVVGANAISLGPVGSFRATIKHNGHSHTTTIGVFSELTKPLLNKDGCIALGLLPSGWPHIMQHPESFAITAGKATTSPVILPDGSCEAIKASILTQHVAAFDDKVLRPMTGEPMSIQLIEGAVASKRYRAYNIPFYWRDKVKEELDVMVTRAIIEKVPQGEPIDWCHPMVVVPKKGSSEPRITVDLTGLNKFVRRPAYPTRNPREEVAGIPHGMKYFSTLDARQGYWQVPLDDTSKKLTTFITPWGCFRFRRNVMGLISAGDEHNRRGDEALEGISNVSKIVEDILVYDMDLPFHIKRVTEVISRCQSHGITLNAKKFLFAQPEVDWCGYRITPQGHTPAPHLYSALSNFTVPTNKTDVRSFIGLVQQFEAFSLRITELAAPLRSLLSAKAAFIWEQPHQRAFELLIKELCSPRVLVQFQPNQPLRLETDAAQSQGLGYALYQQQQDGNWKILQIGSRYVTPSYGPLASAACTS